MLLGLSSFTYGWSIGVPGHPPARPMDEQDLLDRAAAQGIQLVQICDNLPLHRLPPERLARFADRAAAEHIRIQLGSRGLTFEHATEMITLARRLNADLIRFVIEAPEFHPSPVEAANTLRRLLPLLDGIRIGIENHDLMPARTLRALIDDVGSDQVGICLDTANSLGAGEGLESVIAELGPITLNLHIKDFHISRLPHLMGFTVEGRPAGSGTLDVRRLLDRLTPFGRCTSAVLELWTPPGPDIESTVAREQAWAAQSLEFLRPLFCSSR